MYVVNWVNTRSQIYPTIIIILVPPLLLFHLFLDHTLSYSYFRDAVIVSYPGKGECADPVNEDAILEEEGGDESPGRNRERQLASDTGGDKT